MASQRSVEQGEKVSMKEEVKDAHAENVQQPNLQLDTGDEYSRFRQKWWQLW
jgi:ATP-binding cassette, subfamily C (CFTR/MRP), member 1